MHNHVKHIFSIKKQHIIELNCTKMSLYTSSTFRNRKPPEKWRLCAIAHPAHAQIRPCLSLYRSTRETEYNHLNLIPITFNISHVNINV